VRGHRPRGGHVSGSSAFPAIAGCQKASVLDESYVPCDAPGHGRMRPPALKHL